jgi:hypothetical protein
MASLQEHMERSIRARAQQAATDKSKEAPAVVAAVSATPAPAAYDPAALQAFKDTVRFNQTRVQRARQLGA